MSGIKQALWLHQNAMTEKEEAYLFEGGPVPDFDQDRLNRIQDERDFDLEMQAKQAYYDLQAMMESAPSYL